MGLDVKILFPENNIDDLDLLLKKLSKQSLMKPFDNILLQFIEELSNEILLDKNMRQFPDLMTAAHWMRKEQLLKLKEEFEKLSIGRLLFPKGLVLHFAPSNVDTIFIYSWILSLSVGNANIIRLSQQNNEIVSVFFDILQKVINENEKKFSVVADRLLVVTYEHVAEITKKLSRYCNVRVIWGGDQTIKNIRCIPLPARGDEIVFADRFSAAVVNGDHILKISAVELEKLVELFYQDAFLFNQKACSSPKIIFWIGDDDVIARAKQRFWQAFQIYIKTKDLWKGVETAVAMQRLTSAFKYAALDKIDKISGDFFELPIRLQVKKFDNDVRQSHVGGGLFLESARKNLNDLVVDFNIKDQTLTTCGFTKSELIEFAKRLPSRSLDRIVPFGEALKFSYIWDGYNLLQSFTRELTVNL